MDPSASHSHKRTDSEGQLVLGRLANSNGEDVTDLSFCKAWPERPVLGQGNRFQAIGISFCCC